MYLYKIPPLQKPAYKFKMRYDILFIPRKKNIRTDYAGLLLKRLQRSGFYLNANGLPLDEATFQVLPLYIHKQVIHHIFLILHNYDC